MTDQPVALQPVDSVSVQMKAAYFKAIGYRPHREQVQYHTSDVRFKVPCCGRRFGKSTMAARDVEPQLLLPKRRYWAVGPTYDLGEKEFRVIWDDMIIGQGLGADKRVKKAYNKKQGDMYIEFPWQTRLEVRSADHPENLVGEALHGVIMAEAAKQKADTWEKYIRPALGDYRGWATFPTTPEGQNWLHKLWQLGRDARYPDYASWRFPSWANTVLYPGGRQDPEILLLEKTMTHEWFEQEIAADFTAFVGKIFSEFEESTHVTRVEYDPMLPNYMCFDWGYVNPLAAIEFQVTPRDEIRVWREWYYPYKTLEQHLFEMSRREQPEGYKIDLAFGDAADPEAATYVSQHMIPCVALPEAKKNWREGVDLVKTFLKQRVVGEADEHGTPLERPGLIVDHSCLNTIREFNNYRAPSAPRGRDNKSPREAAQDFDDHALDAIRYGMMHLFRLGANSHLSDVMGPGMRPSGYNEHAMAYSESGTFTSAGMDRF